MAAGPGTLRFLSFLTLHRNKLNIFSSTSEGRWGKYLKVLCLKEHKMNYCENLGVGGIEREER